MSEIKLCKDCKYFLEKKVDGIIVADECECTHSNSFTTCVITGKKSLTTCKKMREIECGFSADYFEAKADKPDQTE